MSETEKKKQGAQKYLVVHGIDYPPDRRAEPGAVVDDIPESAVGWLLRGGHIKAVKDEPKKQSAAGGVVSKPLVVLMSDGPGPERVVPIAKKDSVK